jgi:flagellar motor switch protein FliM
MSVSSSPKDYDREVFDRILGRKGDAARLEPACKAIKKFLAQRLQAILQKNGLDVAAEFSESHNSSATALFARYKSGAACVVLSAKPPSAAAYVICDYPAAGILSEIMLGGDPEFAALSSNRKPTATECDLMRQFADLVGQALQTSLSTKDLPTGVRVAFNADDLRDGGNGGSVVAFDLTLQFGNARPVISVAITHAYMLQMAREEPETIRKPAARGHASTNRSALTIKVPASGSVTMPPMTLGELAMLRPGDVLPLSESGDATVRLRVKGQPLYECSLGRKGANYALCLQRPHRAMSEALNGIGIPLPDDDSEETYDE